MTRAVAYGAATNIRYCHAFGRAVAVWKGTALSYLYADHLGSTTAAWAVATGTLTTQRYWPYGATRTGGVAQTDKLYTG